jgi:hypothetical protein
VVLCVRAHPDDPGETHHLFLGRRTGRRAVAIVVMPAVVEVWTVRTARTFIVVLVVTSIVHVGTWLVIVVAAVCLDAVAALYHIVAVVAACVVLVAQRGIAALSGLGATVWLHFIFIFRGVVFHVGVATTLRSGIGPVVCGASRCESIGCR